MEPFLEVPFDVQLDLVKALKFLPLIKRRGKLLHPPPLLFRPPLPNDLLHRGRPLNQTLMLLKPRFPISGSVGRIVADPSIALILLQGLG